MKAAVFMLCVTLLLSGCSGENADMSKALEFRERILESSECGFRAEIVADYGDAVHTFVMNTSTDSQGSVSFEVISPEPISGITGSIGQNGPSVTFDDIILAFPMFADGLPAPVSAPWIFMKALRSGYISSAVKEAEHWRVTFIDSYDEEPLMLDVWLDEQWIPVQCRIYYDGEDFLALQLEDFRIV